MKNILAKAVIISLICSCQPIENTKTDPEKTTQSSNSHIPKTSKISLSSWTDKVLEWDESLKARSIDNPDLINFLTTNKVTEKDFDEELKIFAQKFIKSRASKSTWLNNSQPDANLYDIKSFGEKGDINPEVFFAQKVRLPKDSQIIVIGDLHGSLHSTIRNLWRLVALGYLDTQFKILKKNTYIVFTGDFVDRGRYSVECLYTLMKIKSANWKQVFLLRGNHENQMISRNYGLYAELRIKYGSDSAERLFKDIMHFYHFLPVVLFAEIKGKNGAIVHFSHGGFSYDAEKQTLVHSPKELLISPNSSFELLSKEQAQGYMWSDFQQEVQSDTNRDRGFKDSSQGVATIGKAAFEQYQEEILTHSKKPLVAIFRGHQDQAFGFKMFLKEKYVIEMGALRLKNPIYPNGPWNWKDVVSPKEVANAATAGLELNKYLPVFTFTTAAEGQGVPFDAFGILQVKGFLENYRLQIHETALTDRPERSFVTIDKTPASNDVISATWSKDGPGKLNWK